MPISSPLAGDQPGAAPVRMRRIGEDRLIEQIFPIAGEFLLRHDLARDRARAAAGAADHDAVADLGGGGGAERQRLDDRGGRAPAPGQSRFGIEAERMALHHAAVAEMQPDGFRFGDEIADGQHQAVIDQHAIAGALGAERFGAEGVGRDDRVQPDHRAQRAIEIETVIARAGLECRRHFPFGQRGHAGISRTIAPRYPL